jgi:signal recognition particle GTPase
LDGTTVVGTATTDVNGDFSFAGVINGTYTYMASTNKTWGGLSMNDVFMARQKFVGIGSFTPLQEMAMDVSWDGILGMNDVFTMRQRFASVISSWAAPDFVFLPQAVTVTGGLGAATYQTLCSGDPDKSYTPPAK